MLNEKGMIKIGKIFKAIYSYLDKFSKFIKFQIRRSFVSLKSEWKYIKIHFQK